MACRNVTFFPAPSTTTGLCALALSIMTVLLSLASLGPGGKIMGSTLGSGRIETIGISLGIVNGAASGGKYGNMID